MPVELTGKITPKGGTFVGMVNANQVIGASGAGGYLVSSAISGIREYQLKVSNAPQTGYFLQYKDSTDELTWAEASSADVAWSGASQFYSFSSNVKQDLLDLYNWSTNTALVKNGFAQVSNGDSIAHNLPGIPRYASVTPSGMYINFGVSCRVDLSNIYVYMTAPGTRNVLWEASL